MNRLPPSRSSRTSSNSPSAPGRTESLSPTVVGGRSTSALASSSCRSARWSNSWAIRSSSALRLRWARVSRAFWTSGIRRSESLSPPRSRGDARRATTRLASRSISLTPSSASCSLPRARRSSNRTSTASWRAWMASTLIRGARSHCLSSRLPIGVLVVSRRS